MAYKTSAPALKQIREAVFGQVAPPRQCRKETYSMSGPSGRTYEVHTRYCDTSSSGRYKFNINPNTLQADYELWICGSYNLWYLIPVKVISQMYNHPEAYPDKAHPKIRIVNVDARKHRAVYAKPSVVYDLTPYLLKPLP